MKPALTITTVAALATVAVVWVATEKITRELGQPALLNGYVMLAVLLLLFLFNSRKKLPMVPLLRAHTWPGNVRELENAVRRLVALSGSSQVDGDPFAESASSGSPPAGASQGLKAQVGAFERGLLEEALRRCEGNRSEAARRLRVSRMTLVSKLKKYGLQVFVTP